MSDSGCPRCGAPVKCRGESDVGHGVVFECGSKGVGCSLIQSDQCKAEEVPPDDPAIAAFDAWFAQTMDINSQVVGNLKYSIKVAFVAGYTAGESNRLEK